jgi:hypothetical protein
MKRKIMDLIDRKLSKKELCMIELYIENLNKNHGLSDKTMKDVKQKIDEVYKDAPE